MSLELSSAITAIATALMSFSVVAAAWQIREARSTTRTSFEDDLSREYRRIIAGLPVEAFFEEPTSEHGDLETFYRYFDLCNEQLFLGRLGRVSPKTLEQWVDGIRGNLSLPLFRDAWRNLSTRIPADFFEDLRPVADAAVDG
jgi:hypothetical protein